MKKILTAIAIFVIFIACAAGVSANEDVPCIEAGCVEVWTDSESTVTVPVSVSNNSGFASFTIDVIYDSAKLTPINVAATDALPGYFISNMDYKEDTVRAVFAHANDIKENAVLFNVTFTVSKDVYGDIPVTVSCDYMCDTEYINIIPTEKNGSVSAKRHAEIIDTVMADTAPEAAEAPAITSFYTTINAYSEPITSVKWKITYDGKQRVFDDMYTTSFLGTAKLGIYVEGLHVADPSKLTVEIEVNKGGSN